MTTRPQTPIEIGGRGVNPAIAEMAAINRWVCAKLVTNKAGKLTKPPFCVGGRKHASSTDPATWDTFDACHVSAFANGEARGIGFVFNGTDDLVGIDLDACITSDGTITPWALEIVRKVDSYTERSVSGSGLHIVCRSVMASEGRKAARIEIYPRGRYFWMTGDHLAGTPYSINAVAPEVLAGLLAQANGKNRTFDDLPADLKTRFLDALAWDSALADRWGGEPPQGEDQSRSAWDMSLARLLRRYGGFTIEDFAGLANVWAYGTGADGDARQRRRAWDKANDDAQEKPDTVSSEDAWPTPVRLLAECESPIPYPIGALPPVMRDAIEEYQTFGQQPVELVACSALSAASLCCQALVDVDRDGNLVGPCSLSIMVVAVSGERKSAADKRMRREIVAWLKERREKDAPALQAAERRFAIWQTRKDGILLKIKRLSGSAKIEDEADLQQLVKDLEKLDGERPDMPLQVELFHEDTSPERLAVNLARSWPSASLWSDEGGLVVGSHAMSDEVALRFLGLLNRLWDGGEFKRERETTTSAHIRGRRFTVSLMVQPKILGRLLAVGDGIARGAGALARFLMMWPPTAIGTRPYRTGDLDSSVLKAFDRRLRELLDSKLTLDKEGGLEPPTLRLSPTAFEVWRKFHDEVEVELGRGKEFADLPDFGSKVAEQAARVACILHLFAGGRTDEMIGAEMMTAGARVALWHLYETRRIFSITGHSGEIVDAQLLMEWLRTREDNPTLQIILQFGPGCLRDKKRRNAAITVLVEHGLARLEKRDRVTHLVINPEVHTWAL
jgi:hypothetical protein